MRRLRWIWKREAMRRLKRLRDNQAFWDDLAT